MARKYVAFDIETAKEVADIEHWRSYRPLGISCAAALPCDAGNPTIWHGRHPAGQPANRLSPGEARGMVDQLAGLVSSGYTLLTWNGLGFDLNVLAEESGAFAECRELAANHVDMMFHVFCSRGFCVGLDKAAQGLRIPGKPPGMSGLLAPQLWAQGRHQEVLDYVAQDVRVTLKVALACEKQRSLKWMTRRGTVSSMELDSGWLTVSDACRLPKPDTSWMDNPLSREQFTEWMNQP